MMCSYTEGSHQCTQPGIMGLHFSRRIQVCSQSLLWQSSLLGLRIPLAVEFLSQKTFQNLSRLSHLFRIMWVQSCLEFWSVASRNSFQSDDSLNWHQQMSWSEKGVSTPRAIIEGVFFLPGKEKQRLCQREHSALQSKLLPVCFLGFLKILAIAVPNRVTFTRLQDLRTSFPATLWPESHGPYGPVGPRANQKMTAIELDLYLMWLLHK